MKIKRFKEFIKDIPDDRQIYIKETNLGFYITPNVYIDAVSDVILRFKIELVESMDKD